MRTTRHIRPTGVGRYPRMSDLFRLFLLAVMENIGYRQLTAAWRFRGLWRFLRKTKGWGTMTRVGFGQSAPTPR